MMGEEPPALMLIRATTKDFLAAKHALKRIRDYAIQPGRGHPFEVLIKIYVPSQHSGATGVELPM